MNRKIAKLWIEALRSGQYQQGEGTLRDRDNKFCCLGVLCNLHAQEHPEVAKMQSVPSKYLGESEFLPSRVVWWAGMKSEAGVYGHNELTTDNDSGLSFTAIATIIEKNWKQL